MANVDQLWLFAVAEPEPNLNLLDRFLVMMQRQNVNTVVCFNKNDIVHQKDMSLLIDIYKRSGYEVISISVLQNDGLSTISKILNGKTTVLHAPIRCR